MSDQQSAVVVKDLYKSFKLPHEQHSGIKQVILNFAKQKKGYEVQHVLDDISFEIQKGEFFGIVGRNGSGKSTLLKLLAGIYTPDKGLVQLNGSLTPFIELGVGFNPELTGRENIFLNGALLGFSKSEMEAMYSDIVEFAELEKFMDQKLKNYSSGMQVRLAFSIAIRAQSDILLLDEVLAVGDEAFQRKCYGYFEDLKREKKTVIIVTHDMAAVERFCDRAMLIENGKIVDKGPAHEVAVAYKKLFSPIEEVVPEETSSDEEVVIDRWGDNKMKIESVTVEQEQGSKHDKKININIEIKCNTRINRDAIIAYTLKSKSGEVRLGNMIYSSGLKDLKVNESIDCTLSLPNIFTTDTYQLDLSIREKGRETYSDFWIDCIEFTISNDDIEQITDLTLSTIEQHKSKGH